MHPRWPGRRHGGAMAVERASPSALAHFDPADLLDALSTGIIMLDAQLCAVYANVAAQDLLAFSLNTARGRPFADFLHDAEGLCGILKRALQTGEGIADRELAVRPAGAPREVRTLDVTITPLPGLTGTHLLLELADTTQRQRITRENDLLARLDGSRLMVQQLAHEIKNPLGGLRGAAQLLERELPAAALKEYTQVIIAEADRLTSLVDSMAGPSRAPSRSELNVHEICEHVYHLLRAEAPDGIVIERDYDPSLPNAMLDRHQLISALHRLVASVQVEDSGPGVPAHLRSSIFYPLVTGRANGTGLGLAVAQDLVTRNGGIIEFESELGRTVFTLLLPLGEDT